MRAVPLSVGSSCRLNARSASVTCDTSGFPVQCIAGRAFLSLKPPERSIPRLRAARPSEVQNVRRFHTSVARADCQPNEVQEKSSSAEAVEGAGAAGRDVNLKVDDLRPAEHPGTIPNRGPGHLQGQDEGKGDEEVAVERDATLDVASASAVEDGPGFFHDVQDEAEDVAAVQGRSVEDAAEELREKAGNLEEEQVREADTPTGEQKSGKKEGETQAVERDATLDVASASAVEDAPSFFQDVEEDAEDVVAVVGRPVRDVAVELREKAEELEKKQVKEAETVNGESGGGKAEGVTQEEGELTRAKAQEKFVETAREGYEVLRWAAEGVVSAGQTARQKLAVVKEVVDKRVKSFSIAAEDTREVSSQVADVAQKKFEELQGSTSKFSEELQVNIKEKKAADSLKPESEARPLEKLGEGLQENLQKVTAEDGPLGQLSQTVSGTLAKATEAAQELTSKSFNRENRDASEDVVTQVKEDYEHECGNDALENDQITSSQVQEQSSGSDGGSFDEGQTVPSKKHDDADIGHDE